MSLVAVTSHIHNTLSPVISGLISPANLGRVAHRVPNKINFHIINMLLNQAFREQIEEGDFEFLTDRALQVEIRDAHLFVGLTYRSNRIVCNHLAASECASDVKLSVDTEDAISLIQQEVDPDTLFFHRKLKISGDTELAHHVKNTIDTLNPDLIPAFLVRLVTEYRARVLNSPRR